MHLLFEVKSMNTQNLQAPVSRLFLDSDDPDLRTAETAYPMQIHQGTV